jgi:5-methylcytosine-specific restriction enzyme subunit McrC
LIKIEEYKESAEVEIAFDTEELNIIQNEFKNKIEVIFKSNHQQTVKAKQHVGYVILPNHIINIEPKIKGINFINMVRYALDLLGIKEQDLPATENRNFYDILVSFFLHMVESLVKRGLHNKYVEVNENINVVRGKILFKEHILNNLNRPDKVFCGFSELTPDILENQIIKFTLFYLSRCTFIDNTLNSHLLTLYKKLDNVELKPQAANTFQSITYTPLNEHYRPMINLCDLLLRDSSIDIETIGQKSSLSFLINMDKLFEDFVGNFLKEKLGKHNVKLQRKAYPEISNKNNAALYVHLDIQLFHNNSPIMILDTKYKEYRGKPEEEEVAQMVLYSNSTRIKQCVLVYTGVSKSIQPYYLKENIMLHIVLIDLAATNAKEFQRNCAKFVNDITMIMNQVLA